MSGRGALQRSAGERSDAVGERGDMMEEKSNTMGKRSDTMGERLSDGARAEERAEQGAQRDPLERGVPAAERAPQSRGPLRSRFSVRWGELDALAHVNHRVYLRWIEEARIILMKEIKLTGGPGLSAPLGPILASLNCDYLAPVTYPSEIEVETWVSAIGRASFTLDYAINLSEGARARRVAAARTKIVAFDYQQQRSAPLSAAQRAALEARVAAPLSLRGAPADR